MADLYINKIQVDDTEYDINDDRVDELSTDVSSLKSNTVSNVIMQYAKNQSSTVAPTEGWTTAMPEKESGYYIWERFKIIFYNQTITYSAPTQTATGNGEDAHVVKITSTKGLLFKNGVIQTDLVATVYSGGNRITNYTDLTSLFGNGAYLQWKWQRGEDETLHTISVSDSRLSENGFRLSLSSEDVSAGTSFICELNF